MSWCLHMVTCHVEIVELGTLLGSIEKTDVVAASGYAGHGENWKGDAQYCGQQFQHSLDRQSETWKVNGCFTLLWRITNSKVSIQRWFQSVNSLLRQAFPEGFMPPWRIQHESHTCSERSLRILMWNASDVQKTLQLNLTRRMKSNKKLYIYIGIITVDIDRIKQQR